MIKMQMLHAAYLRLSDNIPIGVIKVKEGLNILRRNKKWMYQ